MPLLERLSGLLRKDVVTPQERTITELFTLEIDAYFAFQDEIKKDANERIRKEREKQGLKNAAKIESHQEMHARTVKNGRLSFGYIVNSQNHRQYFLQEEINNETGFHQERYMTVNGRITHTRINLFNREVLLREAVVDLHLFSVLIDKIRNITIPYAVECMKAKTKKR